MLIALLCLIVPASEAASAPTPSIVNAVAPRIEQPVFEDVLGQVVFSGEAVISGRIEAPVAVQPFQELGTETTVCGAPSNARRWNAVNDGGSFNCFGPFPYHEWFTK